MALDDFTLQREAGGPALERDIAFRGEEVDVLLNEANGFLYKVYFDDDSDIYISYTVEVLLGWPHIRLISAMGPGQKVGAPNASSSTNRYFIIQATTDTKAHAPFVGRVAFGTEEHTRYLHVGVAALGKALEHEETAVKTPAAQTALFAVLLALFLLYGVALAYVLGRGLYLAASATAPPPARPSRVTSFERGRSG